jgi:hypothetical protein
MLSRVHAYVRAMLIPFASLKLVVLIHGGKIMILLQISGNPRSFYATPGMLVVRSTKCFSCLGHILAMMKEHAFKRACGVISARESCV